MRTWTRLTLSVAAVAATVLGLAQPAGAAATTAGEWHMDTSASMVDTSGNGNNGTPSDISVIPDGSDGSGYHFDGNLKSHVEIPDNGMLDPGAGDFSVSLHARFTAAPNSTVGDYDLIRKGLKTTSGGDWKVEILTSSTGAANPRCWFSDGTNAHSVRGSQDLADGRWHSITCVKTSSADQLIVDGVMTSATPKTPVGAIANSAPVVVGQKWGGGDQYTGDMDELTISTGSGAAIGSDTTPPRVTATTPASNATGVALATSLTATFSEKVTGVGASSFTLAAGGTAVPATYTANTAGTKWTLKPNVSLAKDTRYTVTLTNGITDVAGNQLSGNPVSWQFLTGPAPTVKATGMVPAPGATGVAVSSNVSATFSEPVLNVSGSTFTLTGPSGLAQATVGRSGTTNTWILDPAAALAGGTTYTVTVGGGITDLAGNPLKTVTWTFTTA